MLTATTIAGFIGAALAGAAYVPQIWHLVRVHCSAGISRPAFGVWLGASVLVTLHAIATHAAVFVLLGSLQIVAITTILVCATKYRWSSCAGHLPVTSVIETEPGGSWPRGAIGGDGGTQERKGSGALEHCLGTPASPISIRYLQAHVPGFVIGIGVGA